MYKLMIVEDEPLIRMGLQKYLDWKELGFHEIVEAENGAEGVHTALKEKPDLVITDIRMPLMDGLEMIGSLRDTLPETLFVIWTGYNDFEYAREALRLGNVSAYLLKPLQYEESLRTIQNCVKQLEQKREQARLASAIQHNLVENMQLKRSHFLKQLLEDGGASADTGQLADLCGMNAADMQLRPFVLSYVPASVPSPQSRAWWRQSAEQLLTDLLQRMIPSMERQQLFCYGSHHKVYAFIVTDEEQAPYLMLPSLQQEAERLLRSAAVEPDVRLYFALGPVTSDLPTLSSLLHQADQAFFARFIPDGARAFELRPSGADPLRTALVQLGDKDKMQLLSCLEQDETEQLKQLMRRLGQELQAKAGQIPMEQGLGFIQEVIATGIRYAGKHGINIEETYHQRLLYLRFVDDFDSMPALFEWLTGWMLQLRTDAGQAARNGGAPDTAVFDQIEAYILQHIDQEITLQMVADRFFYNPSYLSRLFKTKLNKNYMAFVTEIRIAYAKRCLVQSKVPMTDVAQMCGYASYKHFVKTFRKMTDTTPSDYRKQMGMMD
ncbi:helix-turn-helix domain-containing protein [Paenibacillus chibensis]|uniref:helix-turn-helix domain-containing protein n=1 Tax=Paenibacillus chibensis TaxID=59846 RepID=UPI000FD90022|nr:helix-turn-helix domain-containing protein [Paenibacillus chibensis]MEC0371711.1 response regulator [Paenibacillus chibensis]